MMLTVIVPCRNEEKHIQNCVESLLNNGYPKSEIEILVVDGLSDDNTRKIVKQLNANHPNVKLIDNLKKKTPFALNKGIEKAGGDYILIASAHSSFDKGYIQVLFDELKELSADVVGGFMTTKVKNETPKSVAIKKVLSNSFGVGNAIFRTGTSKAVEVDTVPFGLYPTELLRSVKGYDERLIRNHDIELSKRLKAKGVKIFLTPKTKCHYYARETWQRLAKNNFDNGKWNMLTTFLTKNLSSLSIRHFVPLLFVLSLILPAILSIFYFPFLFVSFFSLGLYMLTLLFIVTKINKENTTFFHLFWTFIVLHISYGVGSLVGLFSISKLLKK